MRETATLQAARRTPRGKGGARQLRREGRLPAIVYGGKSDPVAIDLDFDEVRHAAARPGFPTQLHNLELGDETILVLPHALDVHPVTDVPIHVDFLRVGPSTRVTVEVPVAFRNNEECPGLRRGGVLNIVRHTVSVTCPAHSIPSSLEFDLTGLDIGTSLHISHTRLEEGVEPTISDRNFTVASIVAPSAIRGQDQEEAVETHEDIEEDGEDAAPTEEDE